MIEMKTKICFVLLAFFCSLSLFGQEKPTTDDKTRIWNHLSAIQEVDPKPRPIKLTLDDFTSDIEDNTMLVGIGVTHDFSFFGGTIGGSWKSFMLDLDGKIGSQCEAGLENFKNGLRESSFFITPQLYLKYFSVGCGLGTVSTIMSTTDTDVTNSSIGLLEEINVHIKREGMFSIRPIAKGYIYFNDDFALVLSVGYNFVIKHSEFNKMDFGLGFKWKIYGL